MRRDVRHVAVSDVLYTHETFLCPPCITAERADAFLVVEELVA